MASGNGLPIAVPVRVLVTDSVGNAANDNALSRVIHADAEKEAVAFHLHRDRVAVVLADESVGLTAVGGKNLGPGCDRADPRLGRRGQLGCFVSRPDTVPPSRFTSFMPGARKKGVCR